VTSTCETEATFHSFTMNSSKHWSEGSIIQLLIHFKPVANCQGI